MPNKIKTIYVVQHSHTDIGYTDLQETVIDAQVENLRSVLRQFRQPGFDKYYRWVCETLFVVDRFLDRATKEEKTFFAECVNGNRIGLSLSYLNFNDGVDGKVLESRIHAVKVRLAHLGVRNLRTAMCADINGISLGQRNALIRSGAEFLYMNVNATHGQPPFGRRHVPFWWESADGRRILVWSAEHYNLGNALGLRHEGMTNGFFESFVGPQYDKDPLINLKNNIHRYLQTLEDAKYPYSFLPVSVSGVFTDNAPHSPEILRNIMQYNRLPDREVTIRMVTLEELYDRILARKLIIPTFRGDMADWWADGIGCIPSANRIYRSALRTYRLLNYEDRLRRSDPDLKKRAEENLLLFSEHTIGHSATASHPYLQIVDDLDMHNQRYAVEAHAAVTELKDRWMTNLKSPLRIVECPTRIRVDPPAFIHRKTELGHFEMEALPHISQVKIVDTLGEAAPVQCRPSPRGLEVEFAYTDVNSTRFLNVLPADGPMPPDPSVKIGRNTLENEHFRITWLPLEGIRSITDLKTGRELVDPNEEETLFMPVYELTKTQSDTMGERGRLGLNIRGRRAQTFRGKFLDAKVTVNGPVYTELELEWELQSCHTCREILRLYHPIPRIDVTLQLSRGPSEDIESLYLNTALHLPDAEIWNRKGGEEVYRPGTDQLAGTAADFAATDEGILYRCPKDVCYAVLMPDTPLVAFEPFCYHDACECIPGTTQNNRRVRAWIMNNVWETNFPIALCGYWSFRFSLFRFRGKDPEGDYQTAADRMLDSLIVPRRWLPDTEDILEP